MRYIKRYPVSLFVILAVIYLSFFKPPSTDLNLVSNIDKLAHFCMYMGLSGMLWFEFTRTHSQVNAPLWRAWVGAFLCPILFSGAIEVMQELLTTHRGGDWMDFVANAAGTLVATLLGNIYFHFSVRKRVKMAKRG